MHVAGAPQLSHTPSQTSIRNPGKVPLTASTFGIAFTLPLHADNRNPQRGASLRYDPHGNLEGRTTLPLDYRSGVAALPSAVAPSSHAKRRTPCNTMYTIRSVKPPVPPIAQRQRIRSLLILPLFASALCLALLSAPAAAGATESHTQVVDAPNSLNAVSCVSESTECVVVGSLGDAFYSTDVSATASATWKSWSGPAGVSPSEAVACPASSLCVLADGEVEPGSIGGNMYYATALGGAWTEAFSAGYGVLAISCPSASFCVDGQEGNGYIRYTTSPGSSSWTSVIIGSSAMNAVDCLSSSFCTVVDSSGHVHVATTEAKIKEALGWKSTDIDGSTALTGIACPAKTSCLAIDHTGSVLDLTVAPTGEVTVSRDAIDGANNLTAITCTQLTCVTVDRQGNVFGSADGGGTWTKQYEPGTNLTSASCASSALCLAADETGNVTAFLPAPASTPPEEPLTGTKPFGCEPVTRPGLRRLCGSLNQRATAKVGYYFAYNKGASCKGGDATPVVSEVQAHDLEVSTELREEQLQPATEYTYCLVATNQFGKTFGQGLSFQTDAPPTILSESASNITESDATLEAQISPGGEATYSFEYGTEPCGLNTCGTKTAPESDPLLGDIQQPASFDITNLKSNTTYYYWALATNGAAPAGVHGEPMQFTTPKGDEEIRNEEVERDIKQRHDAETQASAQAEAQAAAALQHHQEEEAAANKKQAEAGGPPSVTIVKVKLSATRLTIALNLSRAGTITISAPGLKTIVKKHLAAGTSQLSVALTKAGKHERAHHKKIKLTVNLKLATTTVSASKIVTL
jgi:hypothetical protein